MGSPTVSKGFDREEFIQAVAAEMASGVDTAVECWMAEVEKVLRDPSLTTLGRIYGINDVVTRYKQVTGKTELHTRTN